jgi:hypothetical protein
MHQEIANLMVVGMDQHRPAVSAAVIFDAGASEQDWRHVYRVLANRRRTNTE